MTVERLTGGWLQRASAPARGQCAENPYLSARRAWNAHVSSEVSARRMSQFVAVLSLLIALAAVGGVVHLGSQSRFVPYVVPVDAQGRITEQGALQPASAVDPRIVRSTVGEFIRQSRRVTADVALQRDAVFRVFALLQGSDPATQKMSEWFNTEDPFARAARELVEVEIRSILASSPDTWQVDWSETTRDRQGVRQDAPVLYRALVTVYVSGDVSRSEDEMSRNPLGIFVRDYSWSRVGGEGDGHGTR